MANFWNAANAFTTGFSGGVQSAAQIDALWAAKDERKRAEEERVKLDDSMRSFSAYMEQNQDPTGGLGTPEGQQMLGGMAMHNPEVAKAVNSNPGYKYAGVIKDPKKEDSYYIAVQNDKGEVRPVTVGREKGGTPVVYSGSDVQSMALTPLLDPKNDTPEVRKSLGVPADGDIFDALSTKFPGTTGEQLRMQAQAGQEKISSGAVPTAQTGVAGVKNAVKDMTAPKTTAKGEQQPYFDSFVTPAAGTSFSQANEGRVARDNMARFAFGSTEPEIPDNGILKQSAAKKQSDAAATKAMGAARAESAAFNEQNRARATDFSTGADWRTAVQDSLAREEKARTDALVGGEQARQESAAKSGSLVDQALSDLRESGKQPGSKDNFKYPSFGGKPQETAPAADVPQVEQPPKQKPATPVVTPTAKPESVAQRVVQAQRVPSKVLASPQHLAATGEAIGQQIQQMPMQQRVTSDQQALDRLSKLATGKKPNAEALYQAMYLTKSGILTPAQFGTFASTGRLDNTEFDNAYKELNMRSVYQSLDLNERQFAFNQFKEQMDQARHVDNINKAYALEELRNNRQLGKEERDAEAKRVEQIQKEGRAGLEGRFQLRYMQAHPDAKEGEAKVAAAAYTTQVLSDPDGMLKLLGRPAPTQLHDYAALGSLVDRMIEVKTTKGWGPFSQDVSIPGRLESDFSVSRFLSTAPQGYNGKE